MKKKTVGDVPGNVLGMVADLAMKLQNGNITPGQLGKFLKKENPFVVGDYSEIVAELEAFYKKLFGDTGYDFETITIPEKPAGKYRLLIVLGVKLETLYTKCGELFPTWRWTNDDFDKIVVENERDARNGYGPYAIWVKDVVEADEDLRNMSAKDIKKKGFTTETLAERLIHELKFFDETGKHLDVNNNTLCSGSRYSGGVVPRVYWRDGKMFVGRCDAGGSDVNLRARSAVSL